MSVIIIILNYGADKMKCSLKLVTKMKKICVTYKVKVVDLLSTYYKRRVISF